MRYFVRIAYNIKLYLQPFLERRGDWTYCALAIRHLSTEDAGNYTVTVKNKFGEKSNHVRLSMKDQNQPTKYFFFSFFLSCPFVVFFIGYFWTKPLGFLSLFFLTDRYPGGIEPTFFRKPSSRQEGNKLHLECEIEALPKPDIR